MLPAIAQRCLLPDATIVEQHHSAVLGRILENVAATESSPAEAQSNVLFSFVFPADFVLLL